MPLTPPPLPRESFDGHDDVRTGTPLSNPVLTRHYGMNSPLPRQSFFVAAEKKAQLARLLGLPRQRLHLLLVAKTACPDAERTLLLLRWLLARQRGIKPS